MKRWFLLLGICCSQYAFSALALEYQNMRDLKVMFEFAEQHPVVSSTLESISLKDNSIYFDENCKAKFVRQEGYGELILGPIPDLVFHRSNCPINYTDDDF